ncbi:hypothetical protein E2C01_064635 [Portunus trituberculatus]|uniref:Uncharacterized protein n=1 Tax=Portunus trituberculatus TaxID=210409 RepID=A0A5B7HNW8_PORTR|nr:hypothetical protein [Portunus trituberculatus]
MFYLTVRVYIPPNHYSFLSRRIGKIMGMGNLLILLVADDRGRKSFLRLTPVISAAPWNVCVTARRLSRRGGEKMADSSARKRFCGQGLSLVNMKWMLSSGND